MTVEYNVDRGAIASLVNEYVDQPSQEAATPFLNFLHSEEVDSNDLFAKSIIRYLMIKKLWRSGDPLWGGVLAKFFEPRTDQPSLAPDEYVKLTNEHIKTWFDFETPTPVSPKPAKPVKRRRKSA